MRYFGACKRPCENSDNEDQCEVVEKELAGKNNLIVSFELPALELNMHFRVNLSSSKDQQDLLQELMDSLRDVMNCRNCWDNVTDAESTKEKLEHLRLEGQQALADWEKQLKNVETWRSRAENAKSQMNAMRENYHKDLQLLRQQLYQKEKAESLGEEYLPDDIFHYDPTQYHFDDEVGALVKEQIEHSQMQFEQKLQNERNKFQHQLAFANENVAIANEKVQTMMMLLDGKEKLLQALSKRHGGGSIDSTSTMVSCMDKLCADDVSDEKRSGKVRRKSVEAKWKGAFNRLRASTVSTQADSQGESVILPPCSPRRASSVSTVSMTPFCAGGVCAGKNIHAMANNSPQRKRASTWSRKSDARRMSIQSLSVQSVCSTDLLDDIREGITTSDGISEGLTTPCTVTVDAATQCRVEERIDVAVDSATQCDADRTIDVGVQTQPTYASMSEHEAPQVPNQTRRSVPSILECQEAQIQHSESEAGMQSSHAPSREAMLQSTYTSEEDYSSSACSTPRKCSKRNTAHGPEGLRKQVGKPGKHDMQKSAERKTIGSVDFRQVCTITTAVDSELKPGDANRKCAKPSQSPKGPFSRAAIYFRR